MAIIKKTHNLEEKIKNEQTSADLHTFAMPKDERSLQINTLIREKYSLDNEIAILRKIHLGKITDEEFKEYSDYVEECIASVEETKESTLPL